MKLGISEYTQGNKSIQEYYSGCMELWTEFKELVYATIFDEGLAPLQQFHEDSQRDQLLMKMQKEYETVHCNLMPNPLMEDCLGELLWEEQCLLTKAVMRKKKNIFYDHL